MKFTWQTHLGFYLPIHPPSTTKHSPLTYPLAFSDAKNTTGPLKSSGLPHLPAGIRSIICFALVSSLINALFISVAIYPGAMQLTPIPLPAHSLLSAFVSCSTPPFEAEYAGTVSPPWKERRDATFMMRPPLKGGKALSQ